MNLPIRLRLTLISAGLMAVVLVALAVFLVNRLEADLIATVDIGLRSRASVLVDRIGEGGGVSGSGLIEADEAFAQLLADDGSVIASSRSLTGAVLTSAEASAADGVDLMTRRVATVEEPVEARLLATRTQGGDILVVGAALEDQRDAVAALQSLLLVGIPAAVILASLVGWLVAGAALRPIERMRREADAISASEPGRRLAVPATRDELTRLADSLNHMLARLEDAVERERRFLADASHELRTPLANLRAEVDLALRRARTAEELAAALESVRDETDRLGRLAEDLLVLARISDEGLRLRRQPTDLAALVAEVVRSFTARAEGLGVALVATADGEVPAYVDAIRIRQAIGNLVDNALRATPRGGTVTVAARARDGRADLVVSDTGPGLPPNLLDGTGDASGARAAGSTGLGLEIVAAIAGAHGGSVEAIPGSAGGATVRISLPLRD